MESRSRPILIVAICFIGGIWGIFTAWLMEYEYQALNRLLGRPGIEDSGLEYIIFLMLGLLAALFFYFWRIWKLPTGKALVAICIVFSGGCLAGLLAEAITYYSLFDLAGYFVGLGVGNAISRKFGM
jgi:spore maturation protein SpmB